MKRTSLLLALAGFVAGTGNATDRSQRSYYVYVCAESDDTVHKLRFGPSGFEEVKTIAVGAFSADIEGPHGVNISPDGRYWFLSIAHGMPFGTVNKFDTANDEWLADVTVGIFPATMSVSSATGLLYVVNFDLHGDMKPSSISVIETGTMIEVERIDVGIMPHGSRIDASGTRLYSVNMMSDSLMERDTLRFEVARTLSLVDDVEGDATPAPSTTSKFRRTDERPSSAARAHRIEKTVSWSWTSATRPTAVAWSHATTTN